MEQSLLREHGDKKKTFEGKLYINPFAFSGKILPSLEKIECLFDRKKKVSSNFAFSCKDSWENTKAMNYNFSSSHIFMLLHFLSLSLSLSVSLKTRKHSPEKLCLRLQNHWNIVFPLTSYFVNPQFCVFANECMFLRRMQKHWITFFSISYFNDLACSQKKYCIPLKNVGFACKSIEI